jgi:hypothetical protein
MADVLDNRYVDSVTRISSGKRKAEVVWVDMTNPNGGGVSQNRVYIGLYSDTSFVSWNYDGRNGRVYENGVLATSGLTVAVPGDVATLLFDTATGKMWFAINGTLIGGGNPDAGTGQIFTMSGSDITIKAGLTGLEGYTFVPGARYDLRTQSSQFTTTVPNSSSFTPWYP